MSLSMDRSSLSRLNREIADLRSKEAGEVKKAADAQKKVNSALDSARRASSASSATMHFGNAERESRTLQSALDNQARYSAQAATKTHEAARLQDRIAKQEEDDRKKSLAAGEKRQRDDETRRRADEQRRKQAETATRAMQKRVEDLEAQVSNYLEERASTTPTFDVVAPEGEDEPYDVFISHASEDKEDFVDGLAAKAREVGLRVWYDRFALVWGDSIRRKIDEGLAGSYFGIAVLSPSFFAKEWTNYELDGLVEKASSGAGRLLPIWHKLTKDEVIKHSPSLANRLALNTAFKSTDEIVAELVTLRNLYRSNGGPG